MASVGTDCFNGSTYGDTSAYTMIEGVAADGTGTVDTIKVYTDAAITDAEFAAFVDDGSNNFHTDGNCNGAGCDAGAGCTTFTHTTHYTQFSINTGERLGIHSTSSGSCDVETSGGSGWWYVAGDKITCASTAFTSVANYKMSLYGTIGEAPVTTLSPTTIAPTTLAPTTLEPTTLEPTTLAPTTLPPTTLAPTTLAPTTAGPVQSSQIVLGKQHHVSPLSTTDTVFGGIFGKQFFATTDDTASRQVIPCSGTLKNLYVRLSAAPGTDKSYTFTVYLNGVSTSLTVTVSGAAQTGSDTNEAHAVDVDAGDTLSLVADPTNTPTACWISYSTEFTPDVNGETFLGVTTYGNAWVDGLPDFSLTGCYPGDNSLTAADVIIPCSGTVKKLYAKINVAPGAGEDRTFTIYKNDVSTSLTCTIADSNTTANDTTHSFSVAAGDRIVLVGSASDSPTGWGSMTAAVVFLPDVEGNYIIPHTKINDTPTDDYFFPICGDLGCISSESSCYCMVPSEVVINEIWAYSSNGNLTGSQEQTITLRKNGGDTALAVTLDSSHTPTNHASANITFSNFDLLASKYDLVGGANFSINVSYLAYRGLELLTTAPPTTLAPTTVAPTTIPTTVAPTTIPTTLPPTTLAPTTVVPAMYSGRGVGRGISRGIMR